MTILFLHIFFLLSDLKTAEAQKEIKILKYKQILEKYLQISSELDPKMMASISKNPLNTQINVKRVFRVIHLSN